MKDRITEEKASQAEKAGGQVLRKQRTWSMTEWRKGLVARELYGNAWGTVVPAGPEGLG